MVGRGFEIAPEEYTPTNNNIFNKYIYVYNTQTNASRIYM